MQPNKKVLLGMSGGVDSSVAALLLKKQGYEVIGAFMKNFSETKSKISGECAWIEERNSAQKICAILQIPLLTLDFEKEYHNQILAQMFKDYSQGITPNPDISCNQLIKFPLLLREAKKRGCEFIATGHYARIKKTKKGFELLAGKDKTKDQSYFLYRLPQNELAHTLFPVGNLNKSQVREIAKTNNFPNWNKLGTRGICFVGKQNMIEFLNQKIPKKEGIVLGPNNEKLGKHPGVMYYTIGQRVGPKIGIILDSSPDTKRYSDKKLYVASKNLKSNTLVIAPEGSKLLEIKEVKLKQFKLINSKEKIPKRNIKCRFRHLGELIPCKLKTKGKNVSLQFSKPQKGIAPGQHIVIYKKDKVIGGGEICH